MFRRLAFRVHRLRVIAGRWWWYLTDRKARSRFTRFGFYLLPRVEGASVGFVGSTQATDAVGTVTTLVVTRSTAGGNLLVLCVSWNSGSTTSITVQDSNLVNWTKASQGDKSGSTGTRTEIWYLINAAAITSVTITQSAASVKSASLLEFSGFGLGVIGQVDTNTVGGSSTTPLTDTITPLGGDLAVASMNVANTNAITIGTANNWNADTQAGTLSGNRMAAAYKLSTAGSESESWTVTSGNWGATIATFTPSVAPGAGGMPLLRAVRVNPLWWRREIPYQSPQRLAYPLPPAVVVPDIIGAIASVRTTNRWRGWRYARGRVITPTLPQAAPNSWQVVSSWGVPQRNRFWRISRRGRAPVVDPNQVQTPPPVANTFPARRRAWLRILRHARFDIPWFQAPDNPWQTVGAFAFRKIFRRYAWRRARMHDEPALMPQQSAVQAPIMVEFWRSIRRRLPVPRRARRFEPGWGQSAANTNQPVFVDWWHRARAMRLVTRRRTRAEPPLESAPSPLNVTQPRRRLSYAVRRRVSFVPLVQIVAPAFVNWWRPRARAFAVLQQRPRTLRWLFQVAQLFIPGLPVGEPTIATGFAGRTQASTVGRDAAPISGKDSATAGGRDTASGSGRDTVTPG